MSSLTDRRLAAAPPKVVAQLPDYAEQLDAFHSAFAADLRALVLSLPLTPTMKVLDVGCGDGFYMGLFAERLLRPGRVIGLDVDDKFLTVSRCNPAIQDARCEFDFVQAKLAELPDSCQGVDLVWCAQSLYSLPEPSEALRQMTAAVKPGGIVAVLENDALHQMLLPLPIELEMAVRAAELRAFQSESNKPNKFYVARRLPSVFAEAGLEPLGFQTQCIDRQRPLNRDLEAFLQSYLARMLERVEPHLEAKHITSFRNLVDPKSNDYLLNQPWFTISWLNVLVWGRRPVE